MTLLGLEAQYASVRASLDAGKLHHAWLLHGPRGVGKGSFARSIAARLLAESSVDRPHDHGFDLPPDHPTVRLIAAHSHPDYVVVERETWDRDKLIPFDRRKPDDAVARNIRIAQIRWLMPILSMGPSIATRRFVIVDAADDLEASAANALLKSLEEPPPGTVFLLVSHAPGRLLPTIRSRCRALAFGRLSDEVVGRVLDEAMPALAPVARQRVLRLADGSIGNALAFADDDVLALEGALDELATTGDPKNVRRLDLAQHLGSKAAAARYDSFLRRAPSFIAERASQCSGDVLQSAVAQWERARHLADVAVAQSLPAESVVFEIAGCVAALARARPLVKA